MVNIQNIQLTDSRLFSPNCDNRLRKEKVILANKCSLAMVVLSNQLVAPNHERNLPQNTKREENEVWPMKTHTDFDFIEEASPPLLTSLPYSRSLENSLQEDILVKPTQSLNNRN